MCTFNTKIRMKHLALMIKFARTTPCELKTILPLYFRRVMQIIVKVMCVNVRHVFDFNFRGILEVLELIL